MNKFLKAVKRAGRVVGAFVRKNAVAAVAVGSVVVGAVKSFATDPISQVGTMSSDAGQAALPVLNDGLTLANKGLTGGEIVWLTLAGLAAIGIVLKFLRRRGGSA